MPWTVDEIERDWLHGGRVEDGPRSIAEDVNRVERLLGADWIERRRTPPQGAADAPSLLRVAVMGDKLSYVEGLSGADELISKVRKGDFSAESELTAIYLLLSAGTFELELFPDVVVNGRNRVPDFRARAAGDPWTYVEVTQPEQSKSMKRANRAIRKLLDVPRLLNTTFTMEAFLRRDPTDEELNAIMGSIRSLSRQDGVCREELGDLGFLLLNHANFGEIEITEFPEEEQRPRLGGAAVKVEDGQHVRQIVVRVGITDERAASFLTSEARQLPTDAPGLIMIATYEAPGAFRVWEPLLLRRFQPGVHRRVGAVCLFSANTQTIGDGITWVPHTKVIMNPFARHTLPVSIKAALESHQDEARGISE